MYLIIEIQKTSDSQVAIPPIATRSTWLEAESEFCRIRSIAALSQVPWHSVALMNDEGVLYDFKCYEHLPSENT